MDTLTYNFAYLDEQTKRMIRRAILKAVAIPGYQVPFASREMPMPYGWGTGGVQVTAAILGPDDVLKVIDQGADDTTNAVSIRSFFEKTAGVATTTSTADATIIQTRHRIPEHPLTEHQILVYQVPIPEPLRFLEPRETETRRMHALEDYGLMRVKLYEDIARHGHIATTYAYPVLVDDRYVMDPSPTPKFDNPKISDCPALQLYGAGREKRIYAVPPYTKVVSLDFEDHPFEPTKFDHPCALCGGRECLSRRNRDRRHRWPHVRLFGHRSLRNSDAPRVSPGAAYRSILGEKGGSIVVSVSTLLAIRDATETDLPAVLALAAQPGMDDGVVLSLSRRSRPCLARCESYPSYRLFVAVREGSDRWHLCFASYGQPRPHGGAFGNR